MAWSDRLEEPITLPEGRALVTLEDAARYIQKLPKTEQPKPHWQTATGILINAAETGGGWLMLARIGMLRALNHGRPKPLIPPKRVKPYKVLR